MHFVNVLLLVPEPCRSVNEYKVFVFVIGHLSHVVEVQVLQQSKHWQHVHCMSWSSHRSLDAVLEVHVIMVITISVFFETPAWAILELLRNPPPVPVVGNPREGWCTVSCIYFKSVEGRPCAQGWRCDHFPESNPLKDFSVLVYGLSLFEAQSRVRVHRWRLHERLELIPRMRWCSLNAENSLNRFLTKYGVAKSVCYMRELLVLSPLHVVLRSLVVIIVMSFGSVLQGLEMINLLSLWEPCSCRLPPPVIELEEQVVEVFVLVPGGLQLIEVRRNVAHFV